MANITRFDPLTDPLRGKWARLACGCPVSIDEEERRHLIECCAFFRAERFREAQPGRYRKQDFQDAAARIDAILESHGAKMRGLRRAIRTPKGKFA